MDRDPSAPRPTVSVATHLAPSVLPVYAVAARRIGERLGRAAELIVPTDYARCGADLDDVCFVCSVPYVLLARSGAIEMDVVAAPVLRGRRYGGRAVYYSDVIVRSDAAYRRFSDLDGAIWAYNEPFSHSGFLVVLHQLAEIGADASFTSRAIEAGYHDDAIRLVVEGGADWAAIDTQVLEVWLRRKPSLRRTLRVVASLGPSTIQPVVVSSSRLTGLERAEVVAVLAGLHRDPLARPLMRAAGVDRFVGATDGQYADIRRMFDRVERAGLLPEWWWPRWDATVAVGLSPRRPPDRSAWGRRHRPSRPPRPRRSSPRRAAPPS